MTQPPTTPTDRLDHAALAILIVLQALMLAALYTRTPPHPPLSIPLFGLGPFLSASVALAVAAMILGGRKSPAGRAATIAATAGALVSFGPHKWFDVTFGAIWPAVVLAEIACTILIARVLAPALRGRSGRAGQVS